MFLFFNPHHFWAHSIICGKQLNLVFGLHIYLNIYFSNLDFLCLLWGYQCSLTRSWVSLTMSLTFNFETCFKFGMSPILLKMASHVVGNTHGHENILPPSSLSGLQGAPTNLHIIVLLLITTKMNKTCTYLLLKHWKVSMSSERGEGRRAWVHKKEKPCGGRLSHRAQS